MTDDDTSFDDAFDDPALDDPGLDGLRALLPDPRHTAPVPDDVAARLDDVLFELQKQRQADAPSEAAQENPDENPDESSGRTVVPLRPRRSVASRFLVAAVALAAVGAGGIGLTNVLRDSNDKSVTSASDSAGSAPEVAGGGTATAPGGATDDRLANRLNSLDDFADAGTAAPPTFTAANFEKRALLVARELLPAPTLASGGALAPDAGTLDGRASNQFGDTLKDSQQQRSLAAATACSGPRLTDATAVAATYDGRPAVLVVHPPVGDKQLVQVWSCNGATLLNSTFVTP